MEQKYCKILYAGLGNAGKTSIILSLEQEYSKLSKISPTLGIERSSIDLIGTETILWDLGGQEKFREKYIRDERSFLDTDLLFYIVDIKDESLYDVSLKYYKEILNILKEYNETPEIIICIHKFDPEILDNKDFMEKFEKLKKLFLENSIGKVKVFKTSIYDRKSLVESFSYGISKLISDLNKIDLLLLNFLDDKKLEGVIFFEKNSLILSEVYKSDENKPFFLTIIMDMLTTIENIKEMKRVNEIYLVINKQFQFLLKNLVIDENTFFFVLIGEMFINLQDIWSNFLRELYPKLESIISKKGNNNSTID
ncbi:MAG: ADP-ribosylation factor-like protein [Candidatus Helarchaeota archaeon]